MFCSLCTHLTVTLHVFNSFPQPSEKGKTCIHKRQNVQAALECLKRYHVKLVGITSSFIVDGSQKLILALVWNIILNFQLLNSNDDRVYKKAKSELLTWAQTAVEP